MTIITEESIFQAININDVDFIESNKNAIKNIKAPLVFLSVSLGYYFMTEKLLSIGVDPNIPFEKTLRTAAHNAVYQNNEPIVDLLLKYNANFNAIDLNGRTPFLDCFDCPEKNILKKIINKNTDFHASDKNNNNAYHILTDFLNSVSKDLIKNKDIEIFTNLLYRHKVNIEQKNLSGNTPLDMVKKGTFLYRCLEKIQNSYYENIKEEKEQIYEHTKGITKTEVQNTPIYK